MLFHLRKRDRKKELTVLALALHFNIPMCKNQSLEIKKKKKKKYRIPTTIQLFPYSTRHLNTLLASKPDLVPLFPYQMS